jgi:hypothetical protein
MNAASGSARRVTASPAAVSSAHRSIRLAHDTVVLNDYDQLDLWTVRRFTIVGDDVLLTGGYLNFEESVYRRYLPGVAAEIRDTGDGTGTRMANITASSVPLDQLLTMMRDARTDIRPPETGNAGLAANRY